MIDINILKTEEKAVFSLRSLYSKYGYLPFKMSKFEEYELYMRNKDFLVSDRVISFNDTNGKLLALKPDVTLSIIKNGEDVPNTKQKVYYDENVYRVSENTNQFKEIMQTGLECIGDIDLYDIYEVLSLAAKSLSLISRDFFIEVSHLGILSDILNLVSNDNRFNDEALKLISQKNSHDLRRLCQKASVNEERTELLCSLVSVYGERSVVLSKLRELLNGIDCPSLNELEAISQMIDKTAESDRIIFDFSVVSDMNYYNGIVFKGFVSGICESVLKGGQYDNLMRKFKRSSRAIGFAIYLDLLERLNESKNRVDVDIVLLYNNKVSEREVCQKVCELISEGKTVSAEKSIPERLTYKKIIDLREEN